MKIRLHARLLILLNVLVLYACVETYDVHYQLNAELLTVEGFVTDDAGTTVSISKSKNSSSNFYSVPLVGCTAELVTSDGSVVPMKEQVEGVYAPASSFKGKVGQTYQLRFRTPEGQEYESTKETLHGVPEIKKVYQKFDQNGLLDPKGKRVIGSTVDVYIDFDDPQESKNYYLWRWKRYEDQPVCITCQEGQLSGNGGVCVRINSRNPPTYDYLCDKACWEVYYNSDVNIYSDEFANGRGVQGRLIAKVPYHSYKGALIEIEQVGVTQEAYLYYKLMSNQNQTTGTLADTPPAPIIGNIVNVTNPNEKVIGYFGAASSRTSRYWVDRSIYKDAYLVPILGREMNLEPATPFRPPVYPCVLSKSRTSIKPQGWPF